MALPPHHPLLPLSLVAQQQQQPVPAVSVVAVEVVQQALEEECVGLEEVRLLGLELRSACRTRARR